MILFTGILIMLAVAAIMLLTGGAVIAVAFGDVIVCFGLIALIVMLVKKFKGKS